MYPTIPSPTLFFEFLGNCDRDLHTSIHLYSYAIGEFLQV
jgi:hypothetical protein